MPKFRCGCSAWSQWSSCRCALCDNTQYIICRCEVSRYFDCVCTTEWFRRGWRCSCSFEAWELSLQTRGSTFGTLKFEEYGQHQLFVSLLYVQPDFRRLGCGTYLVNKMKDMFPYYTIYGNWQTKGTATTEALCARDFWKAQRADGLDYDPSSAFSFTFTIKGR